MSKNEMSVMIATGEDSVNRIRDCFPAGTELVAGDTKIIWDQSNPDEVDAARATFVKLKAKGFTAFLAEGKEGTKGKRLDNFDPEAERIIMVPRVQGGSW